MHQDSHEDCAKDWGKYHGMSGNQSSADKDSLTGQFNMYLKYLLLITENSRNSGSVVGSQQ
jgi:hypothetical protein